MVASRVDHYNVEVPAGSSRPLVSQDAAPALLAAARRLATSAWWQHELVTAAAAPCTIHFSTLATAHMALSPAIARTFANASLIDLEGSAAALGPPDSDIPLLLIYGVGELYSSRSATAHDHEAAPAHAALFALALARTMVPSEDVVRQLRTMGHGDGLARTDLLARHAFVDSLAELLSSSAQPDVNEDRTGPKVIAIEGAWGAGKSTLMSMTRIRLDTADFPRPPRPGWWGRLVARWRRRKLRAWEADFALNGWSSWRHEATARRVLTGLFNPWACQTAEHVWAGLNECIVSAVVSGDATAVKRFWFGHNVERLDRRHVQRTLRKRIVSPVLRLAVFALPVPLLAQLLRTTTPYTVLGFTIQPVDLALWVTGLLVAAGFLHTLARYVFRSADTLLPAELFGPSGALSTYSAAAGTDDPLRDPHRRARTGLLHGMQQDVHRLLDALGEEHRQLVVFIDDLDRCSPRTTADVFEAINGFVTGSFPTIRFVLAIDAAATAAHLDAAYSALKVADAGRDVDDPSPGWTFLRKLIQLPLPLPRVVRGHVEPLITGLLGTPPSAVSPTGQTAPEVPREEIHTMPTVVVLEHDERVQERVAERFRAQPDFSVRDAKRMLTVWMFYIRVLDRLSPETGLAAVRRACHVVLLAEIVARWPASQRCLHRRVDGTHGLAALAKAVDDNVQWEIEVRRLGLTGDRHRSCRDGVREILRDYDGEEIAKLAEQLT